MVASSPEVGQLDGVEAARRASGGSTGATPKESYARAGMRRMSSVFMMGVKSDTDAFLLDQERVTRAIKNYGRGIVHPRTAKWTQWWDGMSFACLFYTALITPFEVGVLQPQPLNQLTDHLGMFLLFCCNRVVDAFYLCDVVLNFFLAYQEPPHKGGGWVTSRGKIAQT